MECSCYLLEPLGFNGCYQGVWMIFCSVQQLVWELLIGYLKVCPIMFDVVIVEGAR